MKFGNGKTLVSTGLKFTFHRFDQLDKVCKSRFKTWWRWNGHWKENNKAVSSANNDKGDSLDSAMSLTNIRNNEGLTTEPCGSTQFALHVFEQPSLSLFRS